MNKSYIESASTYTYLKYALEIHQADKGVKLVVASTYSNHQYASKFFEKKDEIYDFMEEFRRNDDDINHITQDGYVAVDVINYLLEIGD